VRRCVVHKRLRRVVRVLVVNYGLVVDSFVISVMIAVLVVVHLVSVEQFCIVVHAQAVINSFIMLCIVMLVAEVPSGVLWQAVGVQLGTVVQVTVIWVHVLNDSLMMMHFMGNITVQSIPVVWVSVEVNRCASRCFNGHTLNDCAVVSVVGCMLKEVAFFILGGSPSLSRLGLRGVCWLWLLLLLLRLLLRLLLLLLLLRLLLWLLLLLLRLMLLLLLLLLLSSCLLFSILGGFDTHEIANGRRLMAIDESAILIEVRMSVVGASGVVLGQRGIHGSLLDHCEALVEGVGHAGRRLLGRVNHVLRMVELHVGLMHHLAMVSIRCHVVSSGCIGGMRNVVVANILGRCMVVWVQKVQALTESANLH